MRSFLATILCCWLFAVATFAQSPRRVQFVKSAAASRALSAASVRNVSPSDTVVSLTDGTVLLCCRPSFPEVQNGWFYGPGYSLTRVFTDDGVGPGLVDCISCPIDPNIQPGFLLETMPSPGDFFVNGTQFGWDGYIQFFATSVIADFSNPLLLTLSGGSSATGTFLECTPPGQLCFETGLDFQLVDQGQWRYTAHLIPDAGTPGNYVFRDVTITSFNPVPLVNQPLVPATVAPGSQDFTLTLNGSGFVPGSIVNWNGVSKPTTVVSGSQVTATISQTDVAAPGTAIVQVSNPATGGGLSNAQFFSVTDPTSSLAFQSTPYFAGKGPEGMVAADLDSNGTMDLAVTSINTIGGNLVSVLLGNGDGSFQNAVSYPTGTEPQTVIAADFNKDGKPDFAIANYGSDSVSVMLGNGDGTFASKVDYDTGGLPRDALAADFNSDGALDLVVTNLRDGSVSVLLGNGDGTFQTKIDYATGGNASGVATGDLNSDGVLDLAVATGGLSGVSVLLGNGDGTFQPYMGNFSVAGSQSVALADVNADSKLDLLVAGGGYSNVQGGVSVALGNGDGTFQSLTDYDLGGAFVIRAADFNGDGIVDVLVSDIFSPPGQVSVLFGLGDGSFGPPQNFIQGNAYGLAVGDFDNDGRLDFATTGTKNIKVFIQSAVASFSATSLDFGNLDVGTISPPQIITLSNVGSATLRIGGISLTGNNSSDYAQTNDCPSALLPGALCTFNLTFAPISIGTRTASLQISDNTIGSPHLISLTGVGIAPLVSLNPSALTFATQLVGTTSAPQTLILTNTGNATLVVTSIVPSGDFARTAACGSGIPPGGTCTISVRFKPTKTGPLEGSLTITDNAPDSPQTVPLAGVGTVVKISPTSLTFPVQLIGTQSAAQAVTFTNTGTVTLNIGNIKIAGTNASDFSRTTTCGRTLGAGASCTINITFRPTDKDTRTATLSIVDDGGGSPQLVALTGTGTAVQLAPTILDFGNVKVGQVSQPKTVTLTNVGTTTIHVSKILVTGNNPGDFFQSSSCRSPIAPGAACSIVVRFLPTAQGARSAAVSITDDGGGSPQSVSLTGTGT